MSTPRVSVIMNVRNGVETLPEALDSVLAQTYRDWEVIFWDDGSTDGSAGVLERYPDPRIRYFRTDESRGLGQARAQAMQQARGDWFAFLDQDDIWLPQNLQKQMAICDSDPEVGIVYGRALSFVPSGREHDFDHKHEYSPLPQGNIFRELFEKSCYICMSAALLRRSAVEEIGPIPEFIRTTPDYYLFVHIAQRHSARAIQEVVCRYRLYPGNMSGPYTARIQEEAIWIIEQNAALLDHGLVKWRKRVHFTVWGLYEAAHFGTVGQGIRRILRDGSVKYLLSRPMAKTVRAVRRKVQQPYWKAVAKPALAKTVVAGVTGSISKG